MPRTGALLELSRDHHGALVLGRDAKRAAGGADSTCWMEFLVRIENHWQCTMAAHFEEEERLIRQASDQLDPEAVARILAEHAELRVLAAGPCPLEPRARLSRFGELVSAHVRYEERIFFPQLQPHV